MARCYTGDAEGFPQDAFLTFERGVFFYAFPAARQGSGSLFVSVRDERNRQVARLGGPYTLPGETEAAPFDLPRHCSGAPEHGVPLETLRPGRYQATIFASGKVLTRLAFEVRRLQGTGRVRVVSAQIEDAEGNRRRRFHARDRGIYLRVGLVNESPEQPHEHQLRVVWRGPRGQVGRPLGGNFTVQRGACLDGHDFPLECDALKQDGIRVHGTSMARVSGAYCACVYLDGRLAVEVPFRLVP